MQDTAEYYCPEPKQKDTEPQVSWAAATEEAEHRSKQHCRRGRRHPRDTLDDFPEQKETQAPLELQLKQREAGKASSRSVYGLSHLSSHSPQSGLSFLHRRLADGLYLFQLCTAALSMTSCTSFHHEFMTGSQRIMIWIWFNDIFSFNKSQ